MSSMAAAHDFQVQHRAFEARRPSGGPVRLTPRGRLVLLALLVVVAFAAMSVLGGRSAATGEAGAPVETRTVVVGEGDTLWGIASEVAEPGEVREMIHHIEELNALPGGSLQQGQRLAVPVG